jgi:hypothetical protein
MESKQVDNSTATHCSSPASFTAERMKRVTSIIKEYGDDLLTAIHKGGNVEEHVKGHFYGLRLAIMEELSDCVSV